MSVQGQITRIAGNIASSYEAVSDMGGTIPASQTSDNLPAAIRSIPSGGEVITITDTLDTAGGTVREITAHVGVFETWSITYRDGTVDTQTIIVEESND